jgi:RNA polymerase sigma factor (TIGR02999 family)
MTEMEEYRESAESPWTQSLYGALRSLANKLLEGRGPNCLNPSDIVQEAWLRLRHEQTIKPEDRLGFLRLARRVLRRVLFDHFREQSRIKHGGQVQRITFTNRLAIGSDDVLDAMNLLDVVEPLGEVDPRAMHIFDLAYFGGMPLEEIAEELDMDLQDLEREWKFVKAWLLERLRSRRNEEPNT